MSEPYFQREFRELSFVERWSIARTLRRQSVAEHSYFVTLYADRTMDMLGWLPGNGARLDVLRWAIYHDLPEAGLGDIQGPAKRALLHTGGNLSKIEYDYVSSRFGPDTPVAPIETSSCSHAAASIVRFADRLEEAMFIATEFQMGNRTLGEFFNSTNPKTPAQMVFKRLKVAFSNLSLYNQTEDTMDILWRRHVINSLIRAIEGDSKIIQEIS
jgi:5'-deoxynucleotidase YfbR-like HD superfamily hydrolase